MKKTIILFFSGMIGWWLVAGARLDDSPTKIYWSTIAGLWFIFTNIIVYFLARKSILFIIKVLQQEVLLLPKSKLILFLILLLFTHILIPLKSQLKEDVLLALAAILQFWFGIFAINGVLGIALSHNVILSFTKKFGDILESLPENKFSICLVLLAFILTSSTSLFILKPFPHIHDEVAYLFQAKLFAQGKVFADPPPVAGLFKQPFIQVYPQWFSTLPPGWSAILSLGWLLKMPWIINPLIFMLTLILFKKILSYFFEPSFCRWTIFLLLFSPWTIFLSASFMNHPLSLLLTTLSVYGATLIIREKDKRGYFFVGLSIGLLANVRPLDATFLLAALILLFFIYASKNFGQIKKLSKMLSAIIILFIVVLLCATPSLLFNHHTTGNPFRFPISDWMAKEYNNPEAYALGFGKNIGLATWMRSIMPGHSLWEAILNLNYNLWLMSTWLFGFPFSSLLLPLFFFFRKEKINTFDKLLFFACALFVVEYALVWNPGGAFSPRFYYPLVLILAIWGTKSFKFLSEKIKQYITLQKTITIFPAILLSSLVVSFLTTFPFLSIGELHNHGGITDSFVKIVQQNNINNAIVFVPRERHLYTSVGWRNEIPLEQSPIIWAIRGTDDECLKLSQVFPQRSLYYISDDLCLPLILGSSLK